MTKYWEKTVEYRFLWEAIEEKLVDFAMPLSGKQERGAGDTVFGSCQKLVLVEFKSDIKGLDSVKEKEKFNNYEKARNELKTSDSHHFFVYGEAVNGSLKPKAVTYFSRKSPGVGHPISHGCEKSTFDKYLKKFLVFRKEDGRSGEGMMLPDFRNVLGISAEGKLVTVSTLLDYVQSTPDLASTLDEEPESGHQRRPGMG